MVLYFNNNGIILAHNHSRTWKLSVHCDEGSFYPVCRVAVRSGTVGDVKRTVEASLTECARVLNVEGEETGLRAFSLSAFSVTEMTRR